MNTQSIKVDGKRSFLIGGSWHSEPVENKGAFKQCVRQAEAVEKEMEDLAKPTHISSRSSGGYAEVGFFRVPKRDATGAPLILLVGLLAMARGVSSWAAIFQLEEDLWWFGAQLENVSLPGTDIYGSFDTVMAGWRDKAGLFSSAESKVFVNVEHETFTGSELVDLEEWLKEIPHRAWSNLTAKKISGEISPPAVAAGILAVALSGWMGWDYYQSGEQEKALAAQIAAAQATNQAPKIIPPWTQMPSPVDEVAGCNKAFGRVMVFNAGWKFEGAKCASGQVSAEFSRTEDAGDISDLINNNPVAVITPGGKRAVVSHAYSGLHPNTETIVLQEQALIRMVHQRLSTPFTTVDMLPEASLTANGNKGFKLTLHSKLPVEDIQHLINDIPTLRLVNVMIKPDFSSTIEGTVYAK